MYFQEPLVGSKKTKVKFAWLPVHVEGNEYWRDGIIWLEKYITHYKYELGGWRMLKKERWAKRE